MKRKWKLTLLKQLIPLVVVVALSRERFPDHLAIINVVPWRCFHASRGNWSVFGPRDNVEIGAARERLDMKAQIFLDDVQSEATLEEHFLVPLRQLCVQFVETRCLLR